MDLRWISLLLFALLVLRKSGQLFYDDLGGFRTFAMIDIFRRLPWDLVLCETPKFSTLLVLSSFQCFHVSVYCC